MKNRTWGGHRRHRAPYQVLILSTLMCFSACNLFIDPTFVQSPTDVNTPLVDTGRDGDGGDGPDVKPPSDASDVSDDVAEAGVADFDASGTDPVCGDEICSDSETDVTCCVDCGRCGVVTMLTGVDSGSIGNGVTPGGMASYQANFGETFDSMRFGLNVVRDPGEGTSYFWAHQFYMEGSEEAGYLGLQANGNILGAPSGKIAIASIWKATGATAGPKSVCEPFSGEGIGYSCRMIYDWREGVDYHFYVEDFEQDDTWEITVRAGNGPRELLGTIVVPSERGRLRTPAIGFTEYYGQVNTCELTPLAETEFFAPVGDNQTAPVTWGAQTYGTCVGQASVTCEGPCL